VVYPYREYIIWWRGICFFVHIMCTNLITLTLSTTSIVLIIDLFIPFRYISIIVYQFFNQVSVFYNILITTWMNIMFIAMHSHNIYVLTNIMSLSSLINNFISPLINTVTFIYKWALDLITQFTTTMVSTPTKKKRGRDDKKLSPLSSQPRHLWDSPSSRNKKSTKSSSVTSSCTRSQRKKLLFDTKGLDEHEDAENTTTDKDSSKKKKRSSPSEKAAKDKTNDTNAALSDLIPESSNSPSGSCKSLLLGPRFDTFSNSLSPPSDKSSKHSSSTSTTAKKEDGDKMSPLHPPRRSSLRSHKSSSSISSSDQFKDFTMTPTILYNNNIYQHPLSAGGNRHYHQSPHWSGQVRVNPFSPIPEQYLRPPPTSAQSVPYKSRKQQRSNYHPGFYNKLINLDSPTLQLGNTTTSNEQRSLATTEPQKKKARLNPSPVKKRPSLKTSSFPQLKLGSAQDMFDDDISPNDAMQVNDLFGSSAKLSGSKRRVSFNKRILPQPQSMKEDESYDIMREEAPSNKRMCIKRRGRYLNDFEEVQFLGAGSFGSVNACLSRLDGCMYAVKSISPTGQANTPSGTANSGGSQANIESGTSYLYGGRKMTSSSQCAVPPTPRSDLCPVKKTKSRTIGCSNLDDDNTNEFGMLEGSTHWNDGTLRRMLREVFALAALCQQDDFRTFHIVRYQQAWLEDDGTLYIQTELCSATLRDEMSDEKKTIDVSKLLREILLALELVHQQGMVHLDIKPENIFVSKNGLYKLGDFGMANAFTESGRKSSATPEIEEGDSRYMSKDLLDFSPKDLTKCDIFSLGATLYELCLGKPLPTCGDEWQDLRNGKLDKGINGVEFGDIIKEMMHPDADKRPSATDLLSRDALRSSDATNDSFLTRYKVTKKMKPA